MRWVGGWRWAGLGLGVGWAAHVRGVSTQPGQIALQVTPVPAVSRATTLVKPISPNLLLQ